MVAPDSTTGNGPLTPDEQQDILNLLHEIIHDPAVRLDSHYVYKYRQAVQHVSRDTCDGVWTRD